MINEKGTYCPDASDEKVVGWMPLKHEFELGAAEQWLASSWACILCHGLV